MIGYSGSGYKGMQLYVHTVLEDHAKERHLTLGRNHQEKTIEGDLFAAFVAAGAISKANADDPKKSSLVRCARTDKGVHAAGNVISLKLVIEDTEIVPKINEQLNPQIRVWGIERTNSSFSAYQMCDSRIYEYLIPSYCFLPPHPRSFLGKQLEDIAKEEGDFEGYQQRQEEVANFWKDTEDNYVRPVVEGVDPSIRDEVLNLFYNLECVENDKPLNPTGADQMEASKDHPSPLVVESLMVSNLLDHTDGKEESSPIITATDIRTDNPSNIAPNETLVTEHKSKVPTPIEAALRSVKSAHATAKRAHRIPPSRLARIKSTLSRFIGSHRYHNYTIDKSPKDPSAIRIIKSFSVSDTPIMIGNTEWLSLKVHGQSFMMHQIRKMVSAAALIVRCGCHEGRIQDTFLADRLSIPKAPSLGLLLERPVFDAYNEKLVEFGRERIDFGRHEKKMGEFKQREIYERIFREEEKEGVFLAFFAGLDSTRTPGLLWASSKGFEATKRDGVKARVGDDVPEDIGGVPSEDEHGA